MGKVYDFTKKTWVDDDEDQYAVKKRGDGSMSIVRNSFASPRTAETWRSDPAFSQAKAAIKSGKIAEFNSNQVRAGAQSVPAPAAKKPIFPAPAPLPNRADRIGVKPVQHSGSSRKFEAPTKNTTNDLRMANAGVRSYQPARANAPKQAILPSAHQLQEMQTRTQRTQALQDAQILTLEDLLNKDVPLTDIEKQRANAIIKDREKQYNLRLMQSLMSLKGVSEDDTAFSMQTSALKDKISGTGAFGKGFFNAVSFGGLDAVSKKQDAAANALSGMIDSPMTSSAKGIADSHNGKAVTQIAKEQNPLSYGAGAFAGEAAKYMVYAPLIEGIPLIGKAAGSAGAAIAKATGGKIGAGVATRLVSGRLVDLPFDVINAAQSTDNAMDFAKSVVGDQALGLLTDGALEGLAFGWKQIKAAQKNGQLRKIMDADAIKDADIDAYLEKRHGESVPKTQTINLERIAAPTSTPPQQFLDGNLSGNRFLNGQDFISYMESGKRKKVLTGKQDFLMNHGNPVLYTKKERDQFIAKALDGQMNDIAVFGKVGKMLSDKVAAMSGGKVDISGYYMELNGERIRHPIKHANDTVPVSREQFLNMPEMIMNAEDLLEVKQDKKGVRVLLGKKINGYSVIVELASDSRNSITPVTMYNIPTEEYLKSFPNKISSGIQEVDGAFTPPPGTPQSVLQSTAYMKGSLPQSDFKVNDQNIGLKEFNPVAAPMKVVEQAKLQKEARERQALDTFLAPGRVKMPQGTQGVDVTAGGLLPDVRPPENAGGYGKNSVGAAESAFGGKQKMSALYDNSFQKSSIFTQAEKELANRTGVDKQFQYDVISEKQSMAEAAERVQVDFAGEMENLPNKGSFGGSDVDTSMLILEKKLADARASGNMKDVIKWAKMIQEKGTEAGQMIQAFAKYSRTPEGMIVKAHKVVADYGEKLRAANPKLYNAIDEFAEQLARANEDWQYDLPADPDAAVAKLKGAIEEMAKKNGKIKLDDNLTDEIIKAVHEGQGNRDELEKILWEDSGLPWLGEAETKEILDIMTEAEKLPLYSKERYQMESQAWKKVADHFDSSFMDKWNAWRYMAMLGNPRTHIRNFVGNTIFGAVTRIKNGVAAVLEGATDKTLRAFGKEGIERTKTLTAVGDTALQKAAKEDFSEMYALIMSGGKYNPSDMMRDNKTVFKNRVLEGARKFNSGALEREDEFAMKDRYAANLAGFLKANHITPDMMNIPTNHYRPTYRELTAKPDIKLMPIRSIQGLHNGPVSNEVFKKIYADTVESVQNMPWFGKELQNKDFDFAKEYGVLRGTISTSSLKKAKSYKTSFGREQIEIMPHLNQIFENGVVINVKGDEKGNRNIERIFTLLSPVQFSDGRKGVVKLNVKEYNNPAGLSKVHENKILDILDADVISGDAKKETRASTHPSFSNETVGEYAASGSKISIAEMLKFVNAESDKRYLPLNIPFGSTEEALAKARVYAIDEAKKATFRDDSKLADQLSKFSKSGKAANLLTEGIMPFKKTPINIVKRGIEYSPVGLVQGIGKAVHAIRKDPSAAAEAIDRIAAGLTGTGIMALGYTLAEQGLLSGSARENGKERGFDTLTGNQNYAITVNGKSYTLDWAAPAALPLFVGAELFGALGTDGGITGADMVDSITKIMEPVLDMTMMQGLNDAITSAAYNQTSALSSVAGNALANYATQGVPTLFGQVARAVDGTRRSVYYGKGSFLEKFLPESIQKRYSENPAVKAVLDAALSGPVDIALQKTMAKIPGLSMFLNPKIDQWGREQKNQGDGFLGRLAYNTLSPGFYSEQKYTEIDRELERLYEATGEKGVLPGFASKTIAQKDAAGNAQTKRLDAKEYSTFAKDKGMQAYQVLEGVVKGEAYQNVSDADKAKIVADVYEYTNAVAKTGVSDYKLSGWVEKAVEAQQEGIVPQDYITCRNVLTPLKHNVEKNEVLLGMDVEPRQKEALYRYFVSDSESSQKKIAAFQKVGLDMDDYLTANVEYARIDEAGGSAQEKATAFYHWLDTQNLSKQEYDTVADSMKYFQMFPAEPKAYRPDQMGKQGQEGYALMKEKYGMPEDIFMEYSEVVAGIEGTKDSNGKTISGSQKKGRFQALVQMEMGKGASREQAEANARAFLMGVYGYKDSGWR